MLTKSPIFKYHPGKKILGTGGYGKVELIEVPKCELSLSTVPSSWSSRKRKPGIVKLSMGQKRRRQKRVEHKQRNEQHMVHVARKIYRRKNYFTLEIYNYQKLSNELRERYFVTVYRGYKRRVTHRVIKANDGSVFKTSAVQHCLEMAYLYPNRWSMLNTIEKDNALVTNVFHQLLRCQLDLLKIGGVYYDTSPRNVFVCHFSGKIKLVDYGALFFPINPEELYGSMTRSYVHQQVPHPVYPNTFPRKKCKNLTVYDNYYFGGCSKLKAKPIPAFFGLVTVICTCLYSLPIPDKRGTERVLKQLLYMLYGNEVDYPDMLINQNAQKKLVVALQDDPSLIDRISLCPNSPP